MKQKHNENEIKPRRWRRRRRQATWSSTIFASHRASHMCIVHIAKANGAVFDVRTWLDFLSCMLRCRIALFGCSVSSREFTWLALPFLIPSNLIHCRFFVVRSRSPPLFPPASSVCLCVVSRLQIYLGKLVILFSVLWCCCCNSVFVLVFCVRARCLWPLSRSLCVCAPCACYFVFGLLCVDRSFVRYFVFAFFSRSPLFITHLFRTLLPPHPPASLYTNAHRGTTRCCGIKIETKKMNSKPEEREMQNDEMKMHVANKRTTRTSVETQAHNSHLTLGTVVCAAIAGVHCKSYVCLNALEHQQRQKMLSGLTHHNTTAMKPQTIPFAELTSNYWPPRAHTAPSAHAFTLHYCREGSLARASCSRALTMLYYFSWIYFYRWNRRDDSLTYELRFYMFVPALMGTTHSN